MGQPDDPIGGIWAVRPVGAERRKPERQGEEGKLRRRRSGRDTVTLSKEARQLSRAENDEPVSADVPLLTAPDVDEKGSD